jgi:chromatin assembly factor 1 subunit B
MRVETPQILWNSEADKGINAALNSISMLDSGLLDLVDNDENGGRRYGNVMVTAGNTNIINLWKLSFPPTTMPGNSSSNNNTEQQKQTTKITYLCSLTRQEMVVNAVAFSPDGLHLATGGETGAVIVWSVPPNMRGGGNGRHFWSTVQREQDLSIKIISGQGGGVCDISWSADSKRFIAGTIEHNVFVCEDKNYDANQKSCHEKTPPLESDWKVEFRSTKEHTHYVQGVAYDPLGVYLASMGSDRTVRVFPRKTPPKSKKQVLRPSNAASDWCPPAHHQRMVDQLLTESKLDFTKPKQIKYRTIVDEVNNSNDVNEQQKVQKRHLYADEATHVSFFRRLSWTTDGAYLVTPAALWHAEDENADEKSLPSFATYLFARHKFDEPYKVLSGLEKV